MNNTLFKISDSDWSLTDLTLLEKPEYTYDKLRIAYWQSEVHKNSCSLHATITALSNQFNLHYTLEDRKEILKIAIKKGFSVEWGWTMIDAVNCVVEWTNKNKAMKIKANRISWRLFRKVAYLGYCVVTGFNIMEGFNEDKFDNGILDFSKGQYGDKKYGHLINLVALTKGKFFKRLTVVDNYVNKTRYNEYGIKHSILRGLAADGVLFPSGMIFTEQ